MLPAEKKESVIDKIINFFKGLFRGKNENQIDNENFLGEEEIVKQESNHPKGIEIDAENYSPNYKTIDDVEETDFVKSIKAEDKSYIIFLQQKLKNNEIRVEDLTDSELDEMIKLYKSQLQVA